MPNQAFRGFERPAADRSIHTLTLADLHDPTGGASFPPGSSWGAGKPRPKALLLDFAAGWSEVSQADVGEILPALAEPYARRGGMFMLVMLEGARRGQAADVPNLFAWLDRHRIAYPAVVDPSLDVARFVDPAPCKVIVDPRTMRIIKIATGRETPGSAFWQAFDALLTR